MSDFEKLINASDLIDWIMETDPDWCVYPVRPIVDHIEDMPSAQSESCKYWDSESNFCALYRPSAQPERKEGHWIRWYETKTDDYGELYVPHCKCSECGKEYDPYLANTVIYCMRCGVKMGGDAD